VREFDLGALDDFSPAPILDGEERGEVFRRSFR
jgi:hypothetical protein